VCWITETSNSKHQIPSVINQADMSARFKPVEIKHSAQTPLALALGNIFLTGGRIVGFYFYNYLLMHLLLPLHQKLILLGTLHQKN